MKAVIMCGGLGSRLRPLTETTPKPLLPLLNVPVLKLIIDRVKNAGVTDICLSLGYKAQDIISYCEKHIPETEISYFEEEKPLGTAGGVKNCITETDENVLVLSGDNIFNIDLKKVIDFHKKTHADVTLVGKEVTDPREYGVICCEDDGNIRGFIEKPTWEKAESCLINTGIYVIKNSVLEMIPENTVYDFSEQLFPRVLEEKKRFLCYRTDAFWGDIGEFSAYRELTGEMLKTFTADFMYSGTLYTEDGEDERGNRYFAPCLIGNGTLLGCNNTIGPLTVLGKEAVLGDRCTVRGCMIGERCEIDSGTDVIEAILDASVRIGSNCLIEKNAVIGAAAKIGRFSRIMTDCKIWPGRTVSPESFIARDLFYETPESIEPDIYGISGKAYEQFPLSEAVKLGQAIASVKSIKRIGIGTDGKEESEIYRSVCAGGIRSCGGLYFDFGTVYQAQAYFYSAYCNLDAFIYISSSDHTVSFSFYGQNGYPVPSAAARNMNNYFRFSSFRYSYEAPNYELFRLRLTEAAYQKALEDMIPHGLKGIKLNAECENPLIRKTLNRIFAKNGADGAPGGIQFLINETGTDLYCIENDRFYSGDRIRSVLCELAFAQGTDVLLPEDTPDFIFERASVYNGRAFPISSFEEETQRPGALLLNNLWNFDAVFLCIKTLSVIVEANIDLEQLTSLQPDFVLRKKVYEIDCAPSDIRKRIRHAGASGEKNDAYYEVREAGGTARIRQLGNTNRIRLVVQAADTEAAKEISAQLLSKIRMMDIDNKNN